MTAADHTLAPLSQLAEFDTIIDARSPAEFAEDHIPGAINCPVLDDDERIRVGTLYKQVSPFAARRVGAVLVARNIARHIEQHFSEQPKSWRPLVYCWRGGQRSGAFTHILREIGWSARRLEGGYKSWRHHVLDTLATRPGQLSFRVVAGPTGSGKSRLLDALARHGAQVLHLEALAAHRGSILGALPDQPQPSQKRFDTALYSALHGFTPTQPVFVEAESRRIGQLTLPAAILDAIATAPRLRIAARLEARVNYLLADYAHLCDPQRIGTLLERMKELRGKERVAHWHGLAAQGDFTQLVTELLELHYDRLYERSAASPRGAAVSERLVTLDDLSDAGIDQLAQQLLQDGR